MCRCSFVSTVGTKKECAAAAGADPQRVGLVASLPRILERIQRGEGRGKGCRCASPWVNVGRLVRIRSRARCAALICRAVNIGFRNISIAVCSRT